MIETKGKHFLQDILATCRELEEFEDARNDAFKSACAIELIIKFKTMKEYKVFKDGDLWCAVSAEFTNIQESPAGFGPNPMAALGELLTQEVDMENSPYEN